MSLDDTAGEYRFFADVMVRGSSPSYERLALGVAADRELLRLLGGLPPAKRQPNLLLAAVRLVSGGVPGSYGQLRETVFGRWDEVAAVMLARRTQTNEPGRCAALYPVLASLPQPLALLEVGASAGLCLLPDRYSYEYRGTGGTTYGGAGEGALVLRCRVDGPAPAVGGIDVVWRAGIDLNPLDVADEDDVRWLEALIWPEQAERRERLRRAVALARRDPPRIHAGDLNERLDEVVAGAPEAATLVVFHTAVLDYVPEPGRSAFVARMRRLRGHWLAQEMAADAEEAAYVVALDERPLAVAAMHGGWLRPGSG
ncbi:DUF2332 domain-containing protein [Dactylosporangium matsuzakiense]|uniref:DUF2332 domain-containing protein n=1 Tax=Dactylosporangium matsuzakiense TaxID=53360 RepID=A0A9W6KHE3_9ACTN|nr:DUF2332 domain-containing protein [Dactylosporangium matsuzakiense]UWZ47598.1 DUF2332 domain-containing protein [Dactylosporangium matsuzakiense]GLL01568.1 hypothetical protein GCM10017581_033100 [Dactylosporangium matsuzakiense]